MTNKDITNDVIYNLIKVNNYEIGYVNPWKLETNNLATGVEDIIKIIHDANFSKPLNLAAVTSTIIEQVKNEKVDTQEAEKLVASFPIKASVKKASKGERSSAYFYKNTEDNKNYGIVMPERKLFLSDSLYYSVLFHEMVHATQIELDRNLNRTQFGYGYEEIVAELGSAYLLNKTGLYTQVARHNTIAYISSWLAALLGDMEYVINAEFYAIKAVKCIEKYYK